jgi:hypothetical protein
VRESDEEREENDNANPSVVFMYVRLALGLLAFQAYFLGLLRGLPMKIGSNPRDGPIKWPASTNRFIETVDFRLSL